MDGKTYTNGISHQIGVSQNGVSQNGASQNGVSQFKKKPEFKTAEECKSALEKAVIRRCMADVEIGLLLSGGLDSSILGALMVQPHIKKHLQVSKNWITALWRIGFLHSWSSDDPAAYQETSNRLLKFRDGEIQSSRE